VVTAPWFAKRSRPGGWGEALGLWWVAKAKVRQVAGRREMGREPEI
jgi:hypothetical protein